MNTIRTEKILKEWASETRKMNFSEYEFVKRNIDDDIYYLYFREVKNKQGKMVGFTTDIKISEYEYEPFILTLPQYQNKGVGYEQLFFYINQKLFVENRKFIYYTIKDEKSRKILMRHINEHGDEITVIQRSDRDKYIIFDNRYKEFIMQQVVGLGALNDISNIF